MENENNKKEFNNTPLIESVVTKSKDGKFVIHKTVITDIRPVKYYEMVVGGSQ